MAKHCVVFAEHFLSDGDISMDIGVTAAPIITANYIESYHKVCDVLVQRLSSRLCPLLSYPKPCSHTLIIISAPIVVTYL